MGLLERESCLESLAGYAREACDGDGRLVLIAGEAGVGKSVLVEAFQAQVPEPRWSWGVCDGLFTPRPLGPLFDLADQLGGEVLDLCRANGSRAALFDALLRQVSEPAPTPAGAPVPASVVVIEDVHWADEASIDLLRFLGRRLRGRRVLLIATYRDEGLTAADPLRVALGELATQRSTRRMRLAPLSIDGVRRLAGDSGMEVTELHRLTGGNPFYVTEVVRAGPAEVPPSALDAVLSRAARLSGTARAALDVAALIGSRLEPRVLDAASDASASDVDELLASGLLVGEGAGLRFRHEIARLAVEQGVAPHRRALAHGRILAALGTLGFDDDARMAFHAQEAGDGPAVHRYALRAGRRAAELGAHREATLQYERALRWSAAATPELAPADLADLYEAFATEASLVDRWNDAAQALEAALVLWRQTGDRLREGSALRQLARPKWRLCQGDDALATAQAALAVLEPTGPSAELAWAYAGVANQRMLRGELRTSLELADRAAELAGAVGAGDVLSDVLNTRACALYSLDVDWTDDLALALSTAVEGGHINQAGRAYTNIFGFLCHERRFAEAERVFDEGVDFCDTKEMGTFVTCLRGERTNMLRHRGHWAEGAAAATELLAAAASPINRINALISLGLIRAARGDDDVWPALDEAILAAAGSVEPYWIARARLARAEAAWLEGRDDAAVREAEAAADVVAVCDAWLRGATATWLRRVGSTRTIDVIVAGPYRRQVDGDPLAAAREWQELGCPYEAALALIDAGTDEAMREALAIVDGLGATATGRVIRRAMRRRGIRSIPAGARTATRAHPFGLTRRESEVLQLIVDGRTNAEIAASLFISAKTVDHHVSAVLAKLEAPTRAVAATKATRLGLLTPKIPVPSPRS